MKLKTNLATQWGTGLFASLALVTFVNAANLIVNVSIEASGNISNSTELTGPAGGLGKTWNQITTNSASGLFDSTGATTAVDFTYTAASDGIDYWNNGALQMLHSGLRDFGKGSTATLTFSDLTVGDRYDVYVASTQGNAESGKGTWSTTNTTSSVGAQAVDSSITLNIATWEQGNNYMVLENVVVDPSGNITLTGQAADGYRLPVNGFQLVQVPEPSAALLGGLGLLLLARRRR